MPASSLAPGVVPSDGIEIPQRPTGLLLRVLSHSQLAAQGLTCSEHLTHIVEGRNCVHSQPQSEIGAVES